MIEHRSDSDIRPPLPIFIGVKYVKIWPNFKLLDTPVPKLSNTPDI